MQGHIKPQRHPVHALEDLITKRDGKAKFPGKGT